MEINRLRCRVNYHPRRGGAGAHRWRLHLGTAAPGLGDGAASGSRGGGRRRGGARASGTAAGIGARGGLDWNELDRMRFGARAGKKKGRREGKKGLEFCPVQPHHRRLVTRTDGDIHHHRRLVLPTGGDGRRPHHRRFVLPTGGDEGHHRWSQRPLRPPTLDPAVMRHHQRFGMKRR